MRNKEFLEITKDKDDRFWQVIPFFIACIGRYENYNGFTFYLRYFIVLQQTMKSTCHTKSFMPSLIKIVNEVSWVSRKLIINGIHSAHFYCLCPHGSDDIFLFTDLLLLL